METIFGHENLNIGSRTVATIGTFDGVHLGHLAIIEATVKAAREAGLPSLLLTFDVHPKQVLLPGKPVDALSVVEDKLEVLKEVAIDYVCVLNFRKISRMSASDFLQEVLVQRAQASRLFVGANFRFGAGAEGDPKWLREHASPDMEVTEFPLQRVDDTVVSSTAIRDMLREGKVESIPKLLGRNLQLRGKVVRGAGRGAGLGFPTANIEFEPALCAPAKGVYLGYLEVGDGRLHTVVNCGNKPTFGGEPFTCEAHVLDYEKELYGHDVRLELRERLRDEMKFPSPEALSRQITDDVSRARVWFEKAEN